MHIRRLLTAFFILALPTLLNAETWTSPDGFLSVTPPDESKFQAMPEPPPPFIGLWVSNDGTMKFGVMKTQIPPGIRLIQSSAEEGLAETSGGEVTRLPTRRVAGHEVWSMAAKGPSFEMTQAIVRHDGTLYKLMAATVGGTPDPAVVNGFIDSLSIVEPSPKGGPAASQTAAEPVRDLGGTGERDRGEELDLHELSGRIGSAAVFLAIGLLIYVAMRDRNKRKREETD